MKKRIKDILYILLVIFLFGCSPMPYEDLSDDSNSISIDRNDYEIEATENGDYIEVKFQSISNARSYGYGLSSDNVTKLSLSELTFSGGYYTVKISKDIFSSNTESTPVTQSRAAGGKFSIIMFASTSSTPSDDWILLKSVDVALSLTIAPNLNVSNRHEDSVVFDARSEAVSGGMTYSISYGENKTVQFDSSELPYTLEGVGSEAFEITVSHKYTGTSSYYDQTQTLSVPEFDERQADIDMTLNADGSISLSGIPENALKMANYAVVSVGSDGKFTSIHSAKNNLSGSATLSSDVFGEGFYAGTIRIAFYNNSPDDSSSVISPSIDYAADVNKLKKNEKIGKQSYSVSIPVSDLLGLNDGNIKVSGISDVSIEKSFENDMLNISIGAGQLISKTKYSLTISFEIPSYGTVTRTLDFTTGSFAGTLYEWRYDNSNQFAVIVEDAPAGSPFNYYVYTSPSDIKYNGQKLRLSPLYEHDEDLPDGGVSYSDSPEAYKWNNSKWNNSGINPSSLNDIRTTIINKDYTSAEVDSSASGFDVTTTTSVQFKETEDALYLIFYNYITGGDSLGVTFGRKELASNPDADPAKFETSDYHFALKYMGSGN